MPSFCPSLRIQERSHTPQLERLKFGKLMASGLLPQFGSTVSVTSPIKLLKPSHLLCFNARAMMAKQIHGETAVGYLWTR
jgi:hypothetical protein